MDNKNLNEMIGKMRSLMERIERPHTGREALLNEQMHINEATGVSKEVTRDEIVDILDKQDETGNGGLFATVVYAQSSPVYKTKRKGSWRSDDVNSMLDATRDEFGDSDWHKELSDYNDDSVKSSTPNPIVNVLLVTKYQLHWTTKDNYGKAYGEYKTNLGNLRMKYNIARDSDGMLGDNHNQRQDLGVAQANQTGNLSKDFNMASSEVLESTLYRVDADGNVVGEIPEAAVKAMSTPYKEPSVEKAVRDVLSDEEIKAYMEAKKELDKKFRGRTLNFDGILAIKAYVKSEGISYYYINDKGALSGKNGFPVDQSKLTEIAEENIGEKHGMITGFEGDGRERY